jgi:hypothetical protein
MTKRAFVPTAMSAVLLAFALVLWSQPAVAQPQAITVKISGTVGEAPSEGRPRAKWHLRVNQKEVKLFVTKLEILAGSATNAEVIRQLKVNRAAILTEGGADALKTIESNPPGKPLTIQGTMRWAVTPPLLFVSTAE